MGAGRLLCYLFVLCSTVLVQARTVFVSPGGDDSTAQPEDPERPFKTLTKAFQSLQNGDRLEIGAGQYQVTPGFPTSYFPMPDYAPMRLENVTNVVITGIGQVEIYGEGPGDFLMIQNCSNVRVENLTFKGNRPSIPDDVPEGLFSTVQLRGVNDGLHFEKCRFLHFGNHAISHLWGPKRSYNMVVTNCYFADGGDGETVALHEDGAAVSGISSGARIINNTIERCFRGVEVEGSFGEMITNVLIEGNVITDVHSVGIMLFATDPLGRNRPESYADIRVINNRISKLYSNPDYQPFPRMQTGIMLLGGVNLHVSGNRVEDAPLGVGIWIYSGQMGLTNVVITDNVVERVRGRGIQATQFAFGFENMIVDRNRVYGAGDEGILLNGRNIQCRENTVEDSAWDGQRGAITIGGNSVNAQVTDNIIRNSTSTYADYGIWLRGASDSTIYGNTFQSVAVAGIRDDGVNSVFLPKILSMRRTNSRVNFTFSGFPGREYRLEVAQDIGEWRLVSEFISGVTGAFDYEYAGDLSGLNQSQEFFRIVRIEDAGGTP